MTGSYAQRTIGGIAALLLAHAAWAAEPIKVALIDPLSGPFANVGITGLRGFQAEFERINARGGVLGRSFELLSFDSKSSPQEAAIQVQAAIDQGARYILQGSGSSVGHAVSEAVAKHNARNSALPVLYLNHGALDPALTEEKCHFWHFRFVAHGHMIMNAVTGGIARQAQIRRVFLINQDYAWGHAVSRDARQMLQRLRPDIEVVGDDFHPIGKVKDFAPYAAKIKSARADAVVTGNWGNDLSLLIKAVKDAGLPVSIYAPIAGLQGTPTMMSDAGEDRVHAVLFWHPNIEGTPLLAFTEAFRQRYGEDWSWLPVHLAPELLVRAIEKARSAEPLKVALALEDLRYTGPTGEIWMRTQDHQLMMPLFQTVFSRAGQPGVKYDAEGTGFGWKTEGEINTKDNIPPVACKMQRPEG